MNVAQSILVFGVRCYRWLISPAKAVLFGPAGHCRFEPSCSAYALGALREHGALAGSWLAMKRVCRCHPWGACGRDPVPPSRRRHGRPLKPVTHFTALKPSQAATSYHSASARH